MIDSENGDNEKDELAMNVDKTDYHEADSELGSWFQRQGDTYQMSNYRFRSNKLRFSTYQITWVSD